MRIQERAERLQHHLGLLGVSSDGPIVKHDTNKHMRACATRVYGYTAKKGFEKVHFALNSGWTLCAAVQNGQVWTICVIHLALLYYMRRVYDIYLVQVL